MRSKAFTPPNVIEIRTLEGDQVVLIDYLLTHKRQHLYAYKRASGLRWDKFSPFLITSVALFDHATGAEIDRSEWTLVDRDGWPHLPVCGTLTHMVVGLVPRRVGFWQRLFRGWF